MTMQSWPFLSENSQRTWCIAHRGFSDRAFDNSLQAFDLASQAGADFWEVDVRTTSDGDLVAYHDADLKKLGMPELKISELSCEGFLGACVSAGQPMLRLQEVIERALDSGAGLYIDAKDRNAISAAPVLMANYGIERGIITSFNEQALAELAAGGCPYPRSVLVRHGADPIQRALDADAQILHLCWEWAHVSASELRASGLIQRAMDNDLLIVLWHEERPEVLQQLLSLGVRGICTNHPELFNQICS